MTQLKTALFTIAIFCLSTGWANDKKPSISGKVAIGISSVTHAEIQAIPYQMANRIYAYTIDSVAHVALVQLREIDPKTKELLSLGSLSAYDLASGKCLWTKPFLFNKEHYRQAKGVIIWTTTKETNIIDSRSGKTLYDVNDKFVYVDPASNIGISYNPGKLTSVLEAPTLNHPTTRIAFRSDHFEATVGAINLTTGRKLWSIDLPFNFGINQMLHIDQSHLLIVASGLYWVDLQKGVQATVSAETGILDYSTQLYPQISNLVSNVESDSLHYYFASREKIVCTTKQGKLLWQNELSRKYMSQSTLFVHDSVLYLINKGKATSGIRSFDYGLPFISAYAATTGNRLYERPLKSDKHVNDVDFQRNSALILQEKSLALYSLKDGALITEQLWNAKDEPSSFSNNRIYQSKGDSIFESMASIMPLNWLISTSKGRVMVVNHNLLTEDQLELSQQAILLLSKNGYRFLARPNAIEIINKENQRVAQLNALLNITLIGNTLYGTRDNTLYAIDLPKIINH